MPHFLKFELMKNRSKTMVSKTKIKYLCTLAMSQGFHHSFAKDLLVTGSLDLLQSLKQFFINLSYHILVASLTLMALF